VPSVTYGGAPSFWFRRNPETDEREWFTYDRFLRCWKFVFEPPREPRIETRS